MLISRLEMKKLSEIMVSVTPFSCHESNEVVHSMFTTMLGILGDPDGCPHDSRPRNFLDALYHIQKQISSDSEKQKLEELRTFGSSIKGNLQNIIENTEKSCGYFVECYVRLEKYVESGKMVPGQGNRTRQSNVCTET